jgi:thioester reductase-like protein
MSTGIESCAKPDPKARDRLEAMRRDAVLPGAIAPCGPHASVALRVLLTGATGFLGRQVLRELLAASAVHVNCLVRARDDREADARLDKALDQAGVVDPAMRARAVALRGDTSLAQLGMGDAYGAIASRIDAIYHCAAEVSWVKRYSHLRRTNVLGTLEVIRFACAGRTKPLTFVSSLAVCFAAGQEATVDEMSDMIASLERMPLGYARSKCVAESLLRQAARRGLPVTIVRPGLLAGDTATGHGNPADVVGALIESCVARGEAPDADWLVDSIPVDYAAKAIVALSSRRRAVLDVHHLRHGRPRHWRELVLWLNLFGYPMKLLPTARWLARTFGGSRESAGVLSSYRRFFLGEAGRWPRTPPYEVYLAPAQAAISCDATREALRELGIAEPPLDTPLLRRYVEHYARTGAVPPHRWKPGADASADPEAGLQRSIASGLSVPHRAVAASDLRWERLPFDASAGILNDVAAIRAGNHIGMRRYRLDHARESPLDVVVKAKAEDAVLHRLVAEVAALCDPRLGRAVAAHPDGLGLRRSHLREPALYRAPPPAWMRHMPRCYGVSADAARGQWSIAMEHLSGSEHLDGEHWRARDIEAAVEAAAAIHSAWYGKARLLEPQPWMAPEIGAAQVARMKPLWEGLVQFTRPMFMAWAGPALVCLHASLAANIEGWWGELEEHPRTLIHNDFNSRNLAFRRNGTRTACAFDWELARIGVPQHDLAELLCFVFPQGAGREELAYWLERHRTLLSGRVGKDIDPGMWRRGFALALNRILVERLPLYAMVHRFRPQGFLPRVVRNWATLYPLSLALAR